MPNTLILALRGPIAEGQAATAQVEYHPDSSRTFADATFPAFRSLESRRLSCGRRDDCPWCHIDLYRCVGCDLLIRPLSRAAHHFRSPARHGIERLVCR